MLKKLLSATTLVLTMALTSSTAFAVSLPNLRPIDQFQWDDIDRNYDYEGIVTLSNCSGSLIQFEGTPHTRKAVIMTNGHCVDAPSGGLLKPGEVLFNQPAKRSVGIFDRNGTVQLTRATRVLFATMTDTDVALYELELTYREIQERYSITPFTLSLKHPYANTTVQLVSGFWEKGWDCQIETFIPQLREDVYNWFDSIRYQEGCATQHGSSGSPIVEKGTRTVIGIHNTGNDNGERCTLNNPCEISNDGTVSFRKGSAYGQQTYQIYSCLNRNLDLDLTQKGCLLPKPKAKLLR